MNTIIIAGFLIVLISFTLPAFAESLISIETNSKSYKEGETIIVSGKVTTIIGSTPVTMQIFNEENKFVELAQITVAEDGSYTYTVKAEGPLWTKTGEYITRVLYGEGNIAEARFSYSLKTEKAATNIFEVNAGSYGTFDVEYSINGGIVKNMVIDKNNLALIVSIESTDSGTITIKIPRESFDAKKQDSTDEGFIIIIDGIPAPYNETVADANSRTIMINFEKNDSEITIIGTTIIPEFGTIAMMILAIGTISTILLTRKKFQVYP